MLVEPMRHAPNIDNSRAFIILRGSLQLLAECFVCWYGRDFDYSPGLIIIL